MAMKKKMKGNITSPALPGKSILAEVNNNEAGNIYNSLFAKNRKVEYDNKYIALVNIRTNPDNQIFRVMDDDEDIRILAEDIKRNGLMHNLVVFPEQREEGMVYVLLSGERRFRALNYLQEKGDATWNIVNCNVVITPLSKNERKVLLYSANLQVRGGFSDEAIRRQAIAEFITCLQKEPYNMTEADAKKALKDVSITSSKQIDRDFRIEEQLNKDLLKMLDAHLLTRMECEQYITLEHELQRKIAEQYSMLFNAEHSNKNCNSNARLMQVQNSIHYEFINAIDEARKIDEPDERDERFEKAFAECESAIMNFQQMVGEYNAAVDSGDISKENAIEKKVALEQEDKRVENKSKSKDVPYEGATFVEKAIRPISARIDKKMDSSSFKKGVKKMSKERRDNDIAILDELIEKAQLLKQMIETAK